MKLKFLNIGLVVIALLVFLSGCSVKQYIGKDEYLVRNYSIKIENKPEAIDLSELRSLLRPKPNSRFLGSTWKVHNYFKYQEKKTKFNKWLDKNFSEYPVYFEEEQVRSIKYKLERYLDNVGFFNSKVSDTALLGDRKADIQFTIIPAEPYHISEISYDIPDTTLAAFFYKNLKKTLIEVGDIYNAYTFDDERDRITQNMRDVGYYFFNRNYIQFIVDSTFNDHKLSVVLKVNNVKEQINGATGEFIEKPHTRYFIKNIEIIPDWKPGQLITYDTVPHQIKFWNDDKNYTYSFLMDEKARIKPAAFNSAIKLKPHQPYSATALSETYRSLFNFQIIRTASVSFDTIGAGKNEKENYSYLNSKVQMQTAKLNAFQAEVEGTNSSGDLGIRGSVVLSNRNIFKRADVFSIRVNGGFEAQSVNDSVEGSRNGFFNTFEAGISGNFYFPRFLFPGRLTKFNQRYSPITNVNFGFSYQQRPYYNRNITNLDFGYSWNQNKQIKHIVTPITISYVNINITDQEFQDTIDNTTNLRLQEQYSDHMDAGLSYSFIYNNQNLLILEHFNYFRADFQTSGNLLYGLNNWANSQQTDGYYTLFNVRYAQYFRVNFDYRHYYYFLNKTNAFVIRVLLGMGFPYGNSKEIPYERSFFAGGANDMRGWQFRTLGPGGYSGTIYYERAGDIQIETNLEYRFPIYDFFKGALFVDVGNIYTWQKDSLQVIYPDGEFRWDTWYQQLALDAGVGARFDFSFFIFRIDFAVPLINPAYWTKENGAHFEFPDGKLFGDIFIVNFGIGYPF